VCPFPRVCVPFFPCLHLFTRLYYEPIKEL
jgi:hypothetical protein